MRKKPVAKALIFTLLTSVTGSAVAADSTPLSGYPEIARTTDSYNSNRTAAGALPGTVAGAVIGFGGSAGLTTSRVRVAAWTVVGTLVGAVAGAMIGAGTSPKDKTKEYITSVKASPEYKILVDTLGKNRANQFLEDLITLFEEGQSDSAKEHFGQKYPEIFGTTVGESKETAATSITDKVTSLLANGDLNAVMPEPSVAPQTRAAE